MNRTDENMQAKIAVVVVDDDPFVCASLETILNAQSDMSVTGTGTCGLEAVECFEACSPDILLMDIQMPRGGGLEAAESILKTHPDARIVFLTTFSDDEYIVRALQLGAKGYLIKQDVSDIAPALRSVMAGQSVLGGEVVGRMDSLLRPQDSPAGPGGCTPHPKAEAFLRDIGLTDRERQIVELIAQGMDNREIANVIYIGEGTVRNHISGILQKLDLRNRTQLAVFYYRFMRGAADGDSLQ
jgi:DNA-binding NarL/FixJ family response regulator